MARNPFLGLAHSWQARHITLSYNQQTVLVLIALVFLLGMLCGISVHAKFSPSYQFGVNSGAEGEHGPGWRGNVIVDSPYHDFQEL